MLWYQRGYLPLHASALLVDGRAIAIGASSHSGKSVLAAALSKSGCPLIADDMMVVDFSGEKPMVLPGYQKLRLWKDACEQLGLDGRRDRECASQHGQVRSRLLPLHRRTRPCRLPTSSFCPGSVRDSFNAEPLGPSSRTTISSGCNALARCRSRDGPPGAGLLRDQQGGREREDLARNRTGRHRARPCRRRRNPEAHSDMIRPLSVRAPAHCSAYATTARWARPTLPGDIA